MHDYDGQFSPDGRWIAYTSEESGRPEVYVVPFDISNFLSNSKSAKVNAGKFLISDDGGRAPRWRRDGKQLVYLTPANQVLAAELDRSNEKLKVLSTQALFKSEIRRYSFAPFDVPPTEISL
jgi:eukaryotic-like serine/threonine-protein kinase